MISLIENVHRADMSPMDKARAYQRIYEDCGIHAEVARRVNVSAVTVAKYISLNNLTPSIQQKLGTADGPAGVGTLSRLANKFEPEDQGEALDVISGFTQDIQQRVLAESEGNIDILRGLKDKAMEGAFNTEVCREGLCFTMPEQMKTKVIGRLADLEAAPATERAGPGQLSNDDEAKPFPAIPRLRNS